MIISKFTVLCIIISASIPYAKSSFPQTPPLFIRSDFAIGHDIIDIEKGNFNHDDFADIVLLGNGGNITILLGNGDGSLTEAMHSTIGSESRFIHVDDFNNDCISDLVIENALFLSDGSGNFDEEIALDYSGLYSPVTGDVNGDGFTDLLTVVSHYEDEHIIHQLSVALGYG
ncbi:MAG: VCBS repeat-containing protein, partial [Candidatus Latescibacteria bacterium]|nr:VCBS repeat-containing protein [Candidatus Latescibacterota bacterium]